MRTYDAAKDLEASPETGQRPVPQRATVASALVDVIEETDWRPMQPLLIFVGALYVVTTAIMKTARLPVDFCPPGQFGAAAIFLVGVIISSFYIIGPQLAGDMIGQLRGRTAPSISLRARHFVRLTVPGFVLAITFIAVMTNNAIMKPALFTLGVDSYDAPLEAFERSLFGGVLPTQWLLMRSSPAALRLWDGVYESFGMFLFVSMMIALHREGLRGGARLVLALAVGLYMTLMVSIMIPTRGPIFVHPEWFGDLSGTRTAEVAAFLSRTVSEYAAVPAVRYPVGGISAMPSYHVLSWACGLVCWRWLPRPLFALGAVLVVLNWISTVVLGWHYALDGLAGLALAGVASVFARLLIPAAAPAVPAAPATPADISHGGDVAHAR